MAAPFAAEVRDGKLYGRGSQDMKGSLAAMLAAVKALNDGGVPLAGELILTAAADEEHSSIGTEDIVRRYHADAAIVTEPTDLALCRAHRGFMWFDIETTGRAAHGSRYNEGVDAILHMGRMLAELDKLEQELRARPPHPLAGPPSMHASRIEGGTELSVYPARCRLQLERRTIPGETPDQVTDELQAIAERLMATDPAVRVAVLLGLVRQPFAVDADAPIVQALEQAATRRMGRAPAQIGASFWTDAALLAEAGIPTAIFGPSGQGLHSAEEWVDLASVVDVTHILADTAVAFCGVPTS
jgi:acetylornithine deacetylase